MEDRKDKSDRIRYFHIQKEKQEKRKYLYLHQLLEIKELLEQNEEKIVYNEGWCKFHSEAVEGHKKAMQETFSLDEKKDQEEKLNFHREQIENHHKKVIGYHKKEVESLKKEITLFEEGIKRCEEQIEFLEGRIRENSI